MALIVKCRKCLKRIPETEIACPFCGGADFRFIIDYWPRGRNGGRRHLALPDETRTAQQAGELEKAMRNARTAKRIVSAGTSFNSTVADLFPEYLSWYRLHRAPSTLRDLSQTWENAIKGILGEYEVRMLSNEHFSLYQKMRTARVKNRTVNKELDYFSGFLKWCRREKRIEISPILYERLPCSRPLPIVLSPDEITAIMKSAEREPFYLAFFLCLYALGFRLSEVRFLKLEDFDFENRAVKVRQKGGTEKILPLNDQVIEAVKNLVELWPCKPDDYLFAMKRTGAPVTDIRDPIARICKRAGVTKKVNAHLFRHSVASHLMSADVNQQVIQKYLGHSQISSTAFYTHVAMGNLRSAQDLIFKSTKKRVKSDVVSTA